MVSPGMTPPTEEMGPDAFVSNELPGNEFDCDRDRAKDAVAVDHEGDSVGGVEDAEIDLEALVETVGTEWADCEMETDGNGCG